MWCNVPCFRCYRALVVIAKAREMCELLCRNLNLGSVVVLPRSDHSKCLESRKVARFAGDIFSIAQEGDLLDHDCRWWVEEDPDGRMCWATSDATVKEAWSCSGYFLF